MIVTQDFKKDSWGNFIATECSISGAKWRQNSLWRQVLTRLSGRPRRQKSPQFLRLKSQTPLPMTLELIKEVNLPGGAMNHKKTEERKYHGRGREIMSGHQPKLSTLILLADSLPFSSWVKINLPSQLFHQFGLWLDILGEYLHSLLHP